MPYMLPQPVPEKAAPYVFFEQLFTKEECEKIIEIGKNKKLEQARTGEDASAKPDTKKRSSRIAWLEWESELNWIFERMAGKIFAANQNWWRFNLAGMNEPLQITMYEDAQEGHYDWHEDHGESGAFLHRKLSCVIPLNEGYQGGEFEFQHTGTVTEAKLGTMVVFPSFKTHRVKKVTKGTRWSLVCWVNGPPFA